MDSLTDAEYQKIRSFIYSNLGIEVDEKKKETVTAKIVKLTNRHKMASPREYINFILSTPSSEAVQEFYNEITTNTTEFFRESSHFDYIKANIESIIKNIPRIKRENEIRVWSAPCSSGEEALTLAMVLRESLPPTMHIRILATDISEKVLNKAVRGIYLESDCKGIPKVFLMKYFKKLPDGSYEAGEELRKCITYRLFNLMGEFKFHKGFDIIFCRNLMIYFDNDVQQKLINKFYDVLVENGLFFIGHSESLLNKTHKFSYVQTAVFKK